MVQFAGIITPKSIVFTSPEGKPFNVTNAHLNFTTMCEVFKKLQAAIKAGDPAADDLHKRLVALADIPKTVKTALKHRVTVTDGVVYYLGEAVHNAITERILWGIDEGYDMDPYLLFLENLMDNPSKRAVDELYGFIEKHKMGITDDGCIIAYKKIKGDYTDIYTGKFNNSPGQILEMARNKVDDDKSRTCSQGFHFCAFSYLPQFGASSGNRVVIVKVNPKDVVSIPADYNDAKARCCRYEVIGEYTGDDLPDILGERPVFNGNSDWQNKIDTSSDGDEFDGEISEVVEYADDDDDDDDEYPDYDSEDAYTTGYSDGENEGYQIGYDDGIMDAKSVHDGFPNDLVKDSEKFDLDTLDETDSVDERAYQEGFNDGYDDGYADGYSDQMARYAENESEEPTEPDADADPVNADDPPVDIASAQLVQPKQSIPVNDVRLGFDPATGGVVIKK